MNEVTTPVASACGNSAAWIVTGWAPDQFGDARGADVIGAELEPFMSSTVLMSFLA
jgi:hypothetical protein